MKKALQIILKVLRVCLFLHDKAHDKKVQETDSENQG